LPRTNLVREENTWEKNFTPAGIRNYAYGWDRVENVLWRIYHGELDGFMAEKILIMIGTNNLHLNTDDEIIEGLSSVVQAAKIRQSKSKIILMGLLPRRNQEERIAKLNLKIARVASNLDIQYGDVGDIFILEHKIDESLFSDGLHPNEAGYLKMAPAISKFLVD
jgi:lysophospholipase L1-like esterase